MDKQNKFLDFLKKQIDEKPGIDICLWKLSYSFMKVKLLINDLKKFNQNKIINLIKRTMNSELFNNLHFKKQLFVKNRLFQKNQISYCFERIQDENRPFGKITFLAADPYYEYGRDEAGSSWRRFCLDRDWELLEINKVEKNVKKYSYEIKIFS